MENLQRLQLKANQRVRGFITLPDKKILSGSYANYSNHDIEIIIYNTGIVDMKIAIQINDHSNECAYVIYCDTYEFAEVNVNA